MQVITYQIGIGFDFSPILIHHFLNGKPVRRNFSTKKVYTLTESLQSIKRFRNRDRLLKLYRNKRTKIPTANSLFWVKKQKGILTWSIRSTARMLLCHSRDESSILSLTANYEPCILLLVCKINFLY